MQIYHEVGQPRVLAADGKPLGSIPAALNSARSGPLRAQVAQDFTRIDLTYLGPADLLQE